MALQGCRWLKWLYNAVQGRAWLYITVQDCTWLYKAVHGCTKAVQQLLEEIVYWWQNKFLTRILRWQCYWKDKLVHLLAQPVEGIQFHLLQFQLRGEGHRQDLRSLQVIVYMFRYVMLVNNCDYLFQSICYVVNKRFFTISVCFRSIETSLLNALWLVKSSNSLSTEEHSL